MNESNSNSSREYEQEYHNFKKQRSKREFQYDRRLIELVEKAYTSLKSNLEESKDTIISTSLGGRFGNSDEAMIETSGDYQRIKKRYRNNVIDLTDSSEEMNGHHFSGPFFEQLATKKRRVFFRLPSNNDPPFVPPFILKHGTDVDDRSQGTNQRILPGICDDHGKKRKVSSYTKVICIKTRAASCKAYSTLELPPLIIQGAPEPRPLSTMTVFVKGLVNSQDDETLTHLPYFGDEHNDLSEVLGLEPCKENRKNSNASQTDSSPDDDEKIGVWDFAHRQELLEHGPIYVREEQNDLLKHLLVQVLDKLEIFGSTVRYSDSTNIIDVVAYVTRIKKDRITEIWKSLRLENKKHTANDVGQSLALDSIGNEEARTNGHEGSIQAEELMHASSATMKPAKNNSCSTTPLSYETFMDSYRSLFCRRCFTYDCALHGGNNNTAKGSDLQGELALENEQEQYWEKTFDDKGRWESLIEKKTLSCLPCHPKANHGKKLNNIEQHSNNSVASNSARKISASLTPLQKSICSRAFLIFKGNISEMSKAMDADPTAVASFVQENNIHRQSPVQLTEDYQKRKVRGDSKNSQFYSMKNYNSTWLKRVEKAKSNLLCLLFPCDHAGLCNEDNCSCIENSWFCTKHCIWGSRSRNFFRGCACKAGQCRTRSCPCFASQRECDPDLCLSCGTCSDPPNKPAVLQSCRNDSISMRRYTHLLLGKSTIDGAGWGAFNKYALAKGDFVSEYVGEVITQEEAERRGRIYDKHQRSYLFNLSTDCVVDAARKGNKARYINHSSKPNCCPRLVVVNGFMRIGIFAIEDIEAQSEVRYFVRLINKKE
jgi:hypothetical protein